MRIDAHQHFWNYEADAKDYVWMSDDYGVLRYNFLPSDLLKLMTAAGYQGSITVQAREVEEETPFLLGLGKDNPSVKGVVGWLDLCDPSIASTMDQYADEELLKGFRMLIHDQPDPDFADSEAHAHGVGLLATNQWTYDLLLRTIHLPAAIRLVDRFPKQPFVVDHIAKPAMDLSDWTAWQQGIRSIAERPNVYCKLSGMVTEANWHNWEASTFTPFLDEVIDAFGANRCMIGSDWPVSTCASDYSRTMAVVEQWAARLSDAEQLAVTGDTCRHFYNIQSVD